MSATAQAILVYGSGALSGLLLAVAYALDAASWFSVLRSRMTVVRSANVDQVLFMLSFLVAGSAALFAAVLHVERFGLTTLTLPLAAMSTIMLFFASWFMLRRYQARPVIKIFGFDAGRFADGASLLGASDRGRVRAEPWHFYGATLHGLGNWRAERGAADRIVAEVAAALASHAGHTMDRSIVPERGLLAAAAGVAAPLGLFLVMLAILFDTL